MIVSHVLVRTTDGTLSVQRRWMFSSAPDALSLKLLVSRLGARGVVSLVPPKTSDCRLAGFSFLRVWLFLALFLSQWKFCYHFPQTHGPPMGGLAGGFRAHPTGWKFCKYFPLTRGPPVGGLVGGFRAPNGVEILQVFSADTWPSCGGSFRGVPCTANGVEILQVFSADTWPSHGGGYRAPPTGWKFCNQFPHIASSADLPRTLF